MRAQAEPSSPAISQRDINSALTTRLAYVVSGDAKVDEASRQGLLSLSRVLARRTSLTPGEPVGVDPARDELSFYPLLYWPIVAGRPRPSQEAIAKISAFMRLGGTIIFDTRDALTARPDGPPTPEAQWLRQLLDGVDVPELAPVPADHVVTKTFYLLDGFVGRYVNGVTWIEALPPAPADGSARPARSGDGVSPVIITSNDLAGGWASDPDGESLYALTPGGARQHELALRGGVNLVMYTLTGNYKADQVHVRDLLERLAH
ncbi:LytTR family transcriptional regulator (fragment) [Methylocella tundrae]